MDNNNLDTIYDMLDNSMIFKGKDRGDYIDNIECPACGNNSAFIYHNSHLLQCNKKNTCGHDVTVWDYIQQLHGHDNKDTFKYLANLVGFDITNTSKEQKAIAKPNNSDLHSLMIDTKDDDGVYNYLTARGYSESDIENSKLGTFMGASNRPSKYHDLAIPVYKDKFNIMGYICRDITGKNKPKYFIEKGLKIRETLMGIERCDWTKPITLVEGALDSAFVDNVLGIGGASISDTQVDILRNNNAGDIILGLDNDEAGKVGTIKTIKKLIPYGYLPTIIEYDDNIKDYDDNYLLNNSTTVKTISASEFIFNRLILDYKEELLIINLVREINWIKNSALLYKQIIDKVLEHNNINEELLFEQLDKITKEIEQEEYENSVKHELMMAANSISKGEFTVEEAMQSVNRLHKVERAVEYSFDDFMEDALSEEEKGLKTGFKELDETVEIPRGQITLVAGRASHGKTTLMLNLLLNAIEDNEDKRYAFFSYEEQAKTIITKLIIIASGYTFDSNFNNFWNYKRYIKDQRTDINKINKGIARIKHLLSSKQLMVFDKNYDVTSLTNIVKDLKSKYNNLDACYIDYIQKIRAGGNNTKYGTRQMELQFVSNTILEAAKHTNLALVLGAQLGRVAKQNKKNSGEDVDKSPVKMDNLREAGDLEQDANLILGLWNPSVEVQETVEVSTQLSLSVLKNRNGLVGNEIRIDFEKPILTMKDSNRYNFGNGLSCDNANVNADLFKGAF